MQPFANEPPDPATPPSGAELEAERDALRIQAAAVVAQQAALAEEELRLRQRRTALERQQTQLAAHLKQRRRRLLGLQEEIKADRAGLKQERAALDRERAELLEGLRSAKEAAEKERERARELRERLKDRWRQHWHTHEEALRRSAADLTAERERLGQEADALRQERATFEQTRRRLNGELELGLRQLREEREELAVEQQRWDEALNVEQAERRRREKAEAARATALAEGERKLADEQKRWEQTRSFRTQELEGLELRIRNLRARLSEGQPPATTVAPPAPPAVSRAPESDALRRLAARLADQRRHLLEQWQRLLRLQESWRQDRESFVAEAEATATHLDQREQQLGELEREVQARLDAARRDSEGLFVRRQHLEAWQARLSVREAAAEGERAALLAEVQARDASALALKQQLELVRRLRARRRRQEVEELRAARARCEEVRRQYVALWQDCQARLEQSAREQLALSARRLAVQRYRMACVLRSENSAAAEKRLDKLERRAAAHLARAARALAKQRQALSAEAARLDEQNREFYRLEDELARRQLDLKHAESAWEERALGRADEERRCECELRAVQLHHEQAVRQVSALRDEVERIARALLEDDPAAVPSANRAA